MSEAQIREAFAVFDTDKSGKLSASELKAILSRPTAPTAGNPAAPLSSAELTRTAVDEPSHDSEDHRNFYSSDRSAARRGRRAQPRVVVSYSAQH